jgi:uncharacterized membrane protein
MIVHFPIALLVVGFLADVLSLFFDKKEICFSKIGFYLMILGTLGAIAGYFTGEFFTNELTGAAGELKEKHEVYAKLAMFVMILASAIRIFIMVKHKNIGWLKWLVFVLFLSGVVLVGITGFLGGTLVLDYLRV